MSIRRSFLSFRSSSSRSSASERRIQPQQQHIKEAPIAGGPPAASGDQWAELLPELLSDIIRRLEASEDRWPVRKSVVSCACVCRRWRRVTTSIVGSPTETGQITFPSSLKQPGPKELPIQCFIKRNKKNSTFYLYLSLTPSLTPTFMDKGKFLLAARKFRCGSHSEFIISLDADDLSQGSTAYVGKLRSDFLGINFTIFDSHPPYDGAKTSSCRASRRLASKQISPQVPAGSFEIGQVSYKFNLLKSRGPRRMLCAMQCATSTVEEAPEKEITGNVLGHTAGSVVLRNKAPRWHEHLQCWCLNFHGRVTVASVKNFQLVAAADPNQAGGSKDNETVLLQFGKVADDLFTMDYRQPLSAFQAFAICLTSYNTKFACE